MKYPCPSCPDGNEWSSEGPTGRACQVCQGKAYILGSREEDIGFDDEGNMDNSTYCECDLEPTEEEEMSNKCAACGKLLT